MPGEKGGVNEGLGEGAYGWVRGEGVGRGERGSREGCLAAMVSAEETVEADLETKLNKATVSMSSLPQMRDNQ